MPIHTAGSWISCSIFFKRRSPFGEAKWEIDTVDYHFRATADAIEFIHIITLKTEEYKTIDVIILPNYELLPPDIIPQL